MLHRTTIMLPPKLKAKAEQLAQQEHISLAELIRLSLEEKLMAVTKIAAFLDPFFVDQDYYKGEVPKDISKHPDDYLY